MAIRDPDLRRTWIFGAGVDRPAHVAMLDSEADALILDLEDFTPPQRRGEARELLDLFVQDCRTRRRVEWMDPGMSHPRRPHVYSLYRPREKRAVQRHLRRRTT